MFARYDQLKEFEELGEQNLQFTILTKLGDVISIYYDLAQQQHLLRALDTTVAISNLRVRIAKNRFELGKAARLEVLNAQVDFNTDTTNLLRQQELYNNTRIRLNEQLARDVNIKFSVMDTIRVDNQLDIDQLSAMTLQQNPSLRGAIINKRIAELDLKQIKANRYPAINLSTGYNFNNSQSALGFATQTSGKGFTYGLSASINIFNGFSQHRNEKNASILIKNAQVEYERLNQNINAQLASAYQTYLTNLTLVHLENNNQEIARKNLEITMDKFRLGSITPIQVREAQLNYVNATVRSSNAQYEAKLAEVFLKEISGSLNLQSQE
jgi:outer membrane protein TolC